MDEIFLNNGKRIAAGGHLRFPDSFTGDQSIVLRMYQASDSSGAPIGLETELSTQVKVSGKVYYPVVSQDFDCGPENLLVEVAP